MKSKLFLLILLNLLFVFAAVAQEHADDEMQTLFKNGEVSFGGYGGPRVAFSSFDGKDIWLVGGRGGAIINHSFVIGGAGYGIVNSPLYTNYENEGVNFTKAYLQGGYGGVLIEGIFWPKKIVHVSVPVLIGAGGLLFTDQLYPDEHGDNMQEHVIVNTAFFVIEPGVEVELNVIKFLRISAGVSYRYAHEVELPNVSENPFNGLSASISFKFGKF